MEDNNLPKDVPYIVYEGQQARNERIIKRLIACLVIAIIVLFATNAIWIYEFTKYDMVSYEQDGAGLNNICTGTQGDIDYESTSEGPKTEKQK